MKQMPLGSGAPEVRPTLEDLVQARIKGMEGDLEKLVTLSNQVFKEIRARRYRSEGSAEVQTSVEDLQIVIARVQQALGEGTRVSRRDARRIVSSLNDARVTTKLVADVLTTHASLWDTAIRSLLGLWDEVPARTEWRALLTKYKAGEFLRISPLSLDELLLEDGPTKVASTHLARANALDDVLATLTHLGLRHSWSYTVACIAERLAAESIQGRLEAVWEKLEVEHDLSKLLLPFSPGARQRGTLRPSKLRLLTVFIAAGLEKKLSPAVAGRLEAALWEVYRDPRLFGHDMFWDELERLHPSVYQGFLGKLSLEDLVFFFDHLGCKDPARLAFWRPYAKRLRRTFCVLARHEYAHAEQVVKTGGFSEEERQSVSGALRRARRFRTSGAQVPSAFCLDFGEFVVIEFSITPNAVFLYPGSTFSKHFEPMFSQNFLTDPKVLKQKSLGLRFVHTTGWQAQIADELNNRGIAPPEGATRRRG